MGALIPIAEPTSPESNDRPLDVLFPDLQGGDAGGSVYKPRGGSAKDLLSPRQKKSVRSVSRETNRSAVAERQDIVSRETKRTTSDATANVSRETNAPDLVAVPGASFQYLPLASIKPNVKQPRQTFEQSELDELADSISQVGLLQPIVVRRLEEPDERGATFEIIMGERRFRATQQLGLEAIPAIIRSTADENLLRDALLENLHRTNLNPLEEAAAYAQLLVDFECTQDELSERIARSRPQIANTLRLLKLPASIQKRVSAEVLSAGHARALLGLRSKGEMEDLAERIVQEGLSVRATEDLVRRIRQDGVTDVPKVRRPVENSEAALRAVSRISDALDTQVSVKEGRGRGRIIIEFADADDLERITALVSLPK